MSRISAFPSINYVTLYTPTWRDADGYSNAIGKWFPRFNCHFITDDPQKSFHSLGNAVVDILKQRGVQESIIAELLGHANSSITTGRYGNRYQPHVILEALKHVCYDHETQELDCADTVGDSPPVLILNSDWEAQITLTTLTFCAISAPSPT